MTPNLACAVGDHRCTAFSLAIQRPVFNKVPANSDIKSYPYEYPVGGTMSIFGGDSSFRFGLQAGPGVGCIVAGFQFGWISMMGWGTHGAKSFLGGISLIQSREVKGDFEMSNFSFVQGLYEYVSRNSVPLLQEKVPNSPPSIVGELDYLEIGVGGFLRMKPYGIVLETRLGEDFSNMNFRISGALGFNY